MTGTRVTNVVVAGIGGQGVLKASDILAEAAFLAGNDVKKSEVHGMSQRGGSVASDVRFGDRVFSPMIPAGEAQYLVVLASDQVEVFRHLLKPDGILIEPEMLEPLAAQINERVLNVALLGVLAEHLAVTAEAWDAALEAHLPAKHLAMNRRAFSAGREVGRRSRVN